MLLRAPPFSATPGETAIISLSPTYAYKYAMYSGLLADVRRLFLSAELVSTLYIGHLEYVYDICTHSSVLNQLLAHSSIALSSAGSGKASCKAGRRCNKSS